MYDGTGSHSCKSPNIDEEIDPRRNPITWRKSHHTARKWQSWKAVKAGPLSRLKGVMTEMLITALGGGGG